MKYCLIIFLTVCCSLNGTWAQSPSSAIDSLIKFKVLTVKDRQAFKDELKDYGNAPYRVAILSGLYSLMIQKQFHINPHKTGMMFSYSGEIVNKKGRDSITAILLPLLENINRAGLLSDRIYTSTRKDIDSGRYIAELQLIGQLSEMSSRLESLAPSKILPVAQKLHKQDIVSDSSFIRLQNDINEGKIESSFQLNDYCKFDRTFDLAKYNGDPENWLEKIHRDIALTVPALAFTDFKCTTTTDSSAEGLPETKFNVSLTSNGHIYKLSTSGLNLKNKQGTIYLDELLAGSFHYIFNKILTDQHSPYRLHYIMFTPGAVSRNISQHFALIALREEQTEIFNKEPCLSYMMISMESYDSTLNSNSVDSTITGWKKIGLFSHLSEQEINKAIDHVESERLFSINRLLSDFPDVIYSLDSAFISQRPPYISILNHLSKITHGVFTTTDITQKELKGGGVKLQYKFNGKIHSYSFITHYGWLDAKYSEFLKGLTHENNLAGNFYLLPYENYVIYLTNKQHNYAVKNKLLCFDDIHPKN